MFNIFRNVKNSGKHTFGSKLEDVLRIKEKSERNVNKLSKEYPEFAVKAAESTIKDLEKQLSRLEKSDSDAISIADEIFKILVDNNHTQLQKIKDEFDKYQDIYDIFNS